MKRILHLHKFTVALLAFLLCCAQSLSAKTASHDIQSPSGQLSRLFEQPDRSHLQPDHITTAQRVLMLANPGPEQQFIPETDHHKKRIAKKKRFKSSSSAFSARPHARELPLYLQSVPASPNYATPFFLSHLHHFLFRLTLF